VTLPGLTPYVTPAMLLATNYGISWPTFPKAGASIADQVSAQLDICAIVTSELDTLANQTLRATLDTEQEFGPDYIITILRNGWGRFRLSHWPILQLVSAQLSAAGSSPPTWKPIPVDQMMTEHAPLPEFGTDVPSGSGPGPTAALIPPGYLSWANGRKGFLVQVTSINGFPVCGIDATAEAAATSLHVDDITGWVGARGTIYDPPWRESVLVTAATPDTTDAISGPGTLTLSAGLKFRHEPLVTGDTEPERRILLSTMPSALIQAGYYMATHYGLIRGATASVQQTARGAVVTGGAKGAQDWYDRAEKIVSRYSRVL
jgi:hypothetical protein